MAKSLSWDYLRERMVADQLTCRGISDPLVIAALRKVPREIFVPEEIRERAYDDAALPIACGQTISQPLIVAMMSEALGLTGRERVLEIGTGSGYQTAILAEILGTQGALWSIERHADLLRTASGKLLHLGYTSARLRIGDGSLGLPDYAPYDAMLLAAAAPRCPPALWEQLRVGGRIVIPIGQQHQQLQLLEKQKSGSPLIRSNVSCRFVPLIGEGL